MKSTRVDVVKAVKFRVWVTEEEVTDAFGVTPDQVTDEHFASLAGDKIFEFLGAGDEMAHDLRWDIVSTDYEKIYR